MPPFSNQELDGADFVGAIVQDDELDRELFQNDLPEATQN